MATWNDILSDKKAYPDDTKITTVEGVETTLGEVRGQTMMRSDYSRKTQELSQGREEFSREKALWESSKTEAEGQLRALAAELMNQNRGLSPAAAQDEAELLMQRDPVARKLNDRIAALDEKIAARDKLLEEAQSRLRQHETTYMADQHRRVLADIKSRDKDANEQEIIDFAQRNYIPRLDMAYRLLSEDRRTADAVKQAKADAETSAYERAKRELAAPALPSRRVLAPTPQDQIPSWDDAYTDPDVQAALEGRTPA